MADVTAILRSHGVRVTPQRIAVAECVLGTTRHPTADEVWECVKRKHPTISRATIYNTLNTFVRKHLLRTQELRGDAVVYDPRTEPHHHFIDERTGRIYDVRWNAVRVTGEDALDGFEVREYQVVMRGRKKRR